ncbi:MATE family efflux transporter [Treponema sp. TIM-1]|uniref:MATE family efflux transporter n=1 Tax=Treponema sp. TIM-1 TaxID=2898417 RepID=UPI00397FDBD3
MNQENKKQNPLGVDSIPPLIAKYAVPSIISMLVAAAYNITDQIFIGNVIGMLGNAATNVEFPVVTFCSALAHLIGVGTATNFNIKIGEKKNDEAVRFAGTGITVAVIVGILLFCGIFLFKTPVLLFCGATETVFPLAYSYLGITVFGLPFLLFSSTSSYLIRSDGSPTYSMLATTAGALLNVFLDWLFMFIFGWGIQGAAAATVTSQIVSCIICVLYLPRFKTVTIKREMLHIKWVYFKNILRLGVANFINHIIMTTVNIVMNNTLKHYGALSVFGSDIPLAVAGVVAKLNTILSSFAVGLAQGCQPIFGFNIGAKNYGRVKETYKKAFVFTLTGSFVFFAAFQLFPRQIVSIFGGGNESYFTFAVRYMRIFMMMVCVYGIQPLSVNYFTATGKAKQGIVLSVSRQGAFLLPLLIIVPMIFGIEGVLYAGPIADALACTLSLLMVSLSFKNLATPVAK